MYAFVLDPFVANSPAASFPIISVLPGTHSRKSLVLVLISSEVILHFRTSIDILSSEERDLMVAWLSDMYFTLLPSFSDYSLVETVIILR